MGSLSGSGRDSLSGCRGEPGDSRQGESTGLSARWPSYSGNHYRRQGWIEGNRRDPTGVQAASHRVRTIKAVQAGLNLRKATEYEGENRGPLHGRGQ